MTPLDINAAEPSEVNVITHSVGDAYAEGRSPQNPELLHRPHAFALVHGDGGAKIAYGELHFRLDALELRFNITSRASMDNEAHGVDSAQKDIEKLTAIVPTIGDGGDSMDPDIPNVYHQLDGYGDVYLNWEVDLSEFEEANPHEIISKCYVSTTPLDSPVPALAAMGNGGTDITDSDRLVGIPPTSTTGQYNVKLGRVEEDSLVQQFIASDVTWSFYVLERHEKGTRTQNNLTC